MSSGSPSGVCLHCAGDVLHDGCALLYHRDGTVGEDGERVLPRVERDTWAWDWCVFGQV